MVGACCRAYSYAPAGAARRRCATAAGLLSSASCKKTIDSQYACIRNFCGKKPPAKQKNPKAQTEPAQPQQLLFQLKSKTFLHYTVFRHFPCNVTLVSISGLQGNTMATSNVLQDNSKNDEMRLVIKKKRLQNMSSIFTKKKLFTDGRSGSFTDSFHVHFS